MKKHVKWYTAPTTYVDEETGEELTKHVALGKDYIKIKTDKYHELNFNKTIGVIKCTIRVRRNPQGKLEL